MSELKTLKDLNFFELDRNGRIIHCNVQELREEAIKWVKMLLLELATSGTAIQDAIIDAKIGILADFFNLTEEDLK